MATSPAYRSRAGSSGSLQAGSRLVAYFFRRPFFAFWTCSCDQGSFRVLLLDFRWARYPSRHRSSHPTGRASESEGYVRAGVYRCSSPENLISSSPAISKRLQIFRFASTPPGRYPHCLPEHRPLRHSLMSLIPCQSTPAIDAAISRPNGTLYQLQLSFHTHSTEPEPTARARRAGEEFY